MFPNIQNAAQSYLNLSNYRRVVSNVIFGAALVVLLWLCWDLEDAPRFVPPHLRTYLHFPEGYEFPEEQLNEIERKELAFKVEHLNSRAEVFNWDTYSSVDPDTAIIVITVDKDAERLQYLIISLAQVRYIWRVLLIFSHSYFDEGINNLVKSINFCKVMQIYYPYSLQLYPSRNAGADPGDCDDTTGAAAGPCALRDARRAQRKLHWWWTANYVFEGEWGRDDRVFIYLDESDYVLPDLLYVMHLIWRGLPVLPGVEVVSLGGPTRRNLEYGALNMGSWSPLYDKGMALTAKTWRKISERAWLFCFYDDHRWSHSLVPVFGNFSGGTAEMVTCGAPRVLSTREYGGARCGARRAWVTGQRARLFPHHMRATVTVGALGRLGPRRAWLPAPPAGCWGDPQDHMLCLDPLMKASSEVTPVNTLPSKS